MLRRAAILLSLLSMFAVGPATTYGAALIADLSSHLIAITTGFTGEEVLLFGAIDSDVENDIAVVVRGPEEEVTVWRKERLAGIWVNGRNLTFANVPAFYAVAATRPVDDFAPMSLLIRHQIGAANLRLRNPQRASAEEILEFRRALIEEKTRRGLYHPEVGPITVLGGRLFRTLITFPSNVPTGAYIVEVFSIEDGNVVEAQTTPLVISKVGTEAEIYDFAHDHAAAYGAVAVLIALVAGWLAGAIFRKM